MLNKVMRQATRRPLTISFLLIAILMALATTAVISFKPALGQTGPRVLRDVEYARAGDKRLLLDLYLPAGGGPFPVIIWVHGGGWTSGSKGNGGPAARQVSRGYAVASINYRLSWEARFPAQIEDCKAAVRWLRANAGQYNLDPNRIGAWGSSAGGHLVAMLGTSGDVVDLEGSGGNSGYASRVQAVVDWYGPADLLKMQQQSLPCSVIDHDAVFSPESLLVGCAVQTCPDKARRASPITYVTANDPPFLIMHGTNDCLVPPLQSQDLYDALKGAGVEASLKLLEGAGHGGSAFETAENQKLVDDFLDRHLMKATPVPSVVKIDTASVSGKKLLVFGKNFDSGASVLLNGQKQKTVNDDQNPTTLLIGKKAGKKIDRGQTVMLQVKNSDGRLSQEFSFTRP